MFFALNPSTKVTEGVYTERTAGIWSHAEWNVYNIDKDKTASGHILCDKFFRISVILSCSILSCSRVFVRET